jgi:ATP-binding cassette subfamily A (ABC1) protein 3
MYSMYGVVAWLIVEKETKIRESLKMMGVHTGSLLVSFYGLQAMVFGGLSLIFSLFLCRFSPGDAAVFPASSPILIFLLFFLWCMAFVSFAFAFHTFFHKAMTGGIVAALAMLGQYVIYRGLTEDSGSTSAGTLALLCLLPNCALPLAIDLIGTLESLHIGATFGNIFYSLNNASLGMILGMLLLDCFLWTVLGWYLENVLPKEFGIQQHPLFLFQKSFWTGQPAESKSGALLALDQAESLVARLSRNLLGDTSDVSPERAEENGSVEPVAPELKSCIEIKGLRKVFPTPAGTKVAVSSLNLDMYEGQIFALLGHNGAGEKLTIFVCFQSFGWCLNIWLAIVLTGC